MACSENIDLTLSKTPLKDLSQLKEYQGRLVSETGSRSSEREYLARKMSFLANARLASTPNSQLQNCHFLANAPT